MELDRRFATLLLGMTFGFVFLGTFFPPGDYAFSHLLLNYENGFLRRGLFGQLLTWIFPAGMTWQAVYVVSGLMTLTASVALMLYVSAALMRSRYGGAVAFVFVSSIAFASFTGHIGMLDSILTLLALLALAAPASVAGIFAKCAVCVVGVLVHENFLALYAPLVSCQLWLSYDAPHTARRMAIASLPVVAAIAAAVVVFAFGNFDAGSLDQMLAYYQSRAIGFGIQDRVVETVTSSADGASKLWDPKTPSLGNILMTINQGSVGLVYLFLVLRLLYRLIRQRPVLDRIAITGAVIAPVFLCLAAYDVSRFIGTAIINAFLLTGLLCVYDPRIRDALGQVFSAKWVLVFLALNSGLALRDYNSMSTFFYRLPASLIFQLNWLSPPGEVGNQDIGKFRGTLDKPAM